VNTNAEYLIKVLQHEAFKSGDVDTGFVNTYAEDLVKDSLSVNQRRAVLSAAMLSDRHIKLLMESTPDIYAAIGRWSN